MVPLAAAQVVAQGRERDGLLTLVWWADEVWLALTDRDGSYYGRLAAQGTFQRFNPLMDKEYDLDIATGLFSPTEDVRWAEAREGLRVAGASINHPFILNVADWREQIPVGGAVSLVARFRRQRSLTTQRDYPQVGLAWREMLGSPWTLTTSIGMHFFKSSADVELRLTRAWSRLSADLRVAVLDAFNNVIFNALGVEPEETPAHFDYSTLPIAARLGLGWSSRNVRLELHGGFSNRSRVLVSFPAAGDPSYALAERVSFGGGLVEVALTGGASVAAFGTTARAATDRRFTPASASDFRLRERTSAFGLRGRLAAGPTLAVELDLVGLWQPEDRTRGDGTSVRHRDRELFGQVALTRRPRVGWTWRLGYGVLDRQAGVLAPWLTAQNHRQLMEGGYRFRSGFEVTAGLRWDLDRLFARIFDGGHLRFAATW